MNSQLCQHYLLNKPFFPTELKYYLCHILNYDIYWDLYLDPFFCSTDLSTLMPIPFWLYYSDFYYNGFQLKASLSLFIFFIVFFAFQAFIFPYVFHIDFKTILSTPSTPPKKPVRIINGMCYIYLGRLLLVFVYKNFSIYLFKREILSHLKNEQFLDN